MAHLHSVYDTDSHFSIDPITRTIKNESPKKVTVMQYDHNSERFTFEVTRYIEGHDMSICNRVEVHYQNGDTKGVYEVKDLQVYPEDENIVVCSWLISQNCTKFAAALDFRLTFKCIADDGTTLDYIWSTAMHRGISVSAGISNSDAVVEQYADVLEEWEQILFGTGGTADIEQMKKDIADLKYVPIDITSFTGNLTLAKGDTLTERKLSWAINKDPISQTFDGEALDVSVRSKQLAGLSITSDTKFTLVVTDERGNTDKAESYVYFYNKLYYGVVDDGATIDDSFLANLSYKVQKSKGTNFNVNPNSQRIIFALPESYGTPSFKDAATGFQADMYLADTIKMVHGTYTDNYKVWLSTNILTGSKTITVA